MTVPGASAAEVRSTVFNLIIDEEVDSPLVASMTIDVESKSFPITPRSKAHPIGVYEYSKAVTGQIVFEQAGHSLDRFMLDLADNGTVSVEAAGSLMEKHKLRLNDPADVENANDLFIHEVYFTRVTKSYGEGEPVKLKPALDFVAYPVGSGEDAGKIITIGEPLPAP